MRGLLAGRVEPDAYEGFLNAGFRRSGSVLYQPVCVGCRECTPLRIDLESFKPSPGQRRNLRRNRDLRLRCGTPVLTEEKLRLYEMYLRGQHGEGDRSIEEAVETLGEFLYQSPVQTIEVEYRTEAGGLAGVGICDVTSAVLSSVYFYWDPAVRRRGMGCFSMLQEIELARQLGLRWYHLGYWVNGSPTMHYKATLADHEVLGTDGQWRRAERKH
jgi:leucyl-tRNA---protein transferase